MHDAVSCTIGEPDHSANSVQHTDRGALAEPNHDAHQRTDFFSDSSTKRKSDISTFIEPHSNADDSCSGL